MDAVKPQYTNALAHETSPYLLQHAHNPVNWQPWGEDAFRRARDENKPVFLSIGYAACHWCHVMERESFENEELARLLNENFISIKVDREERPDLDDIYMQAVQLMSGSGGWPMSVFLTAEGKPFFGGTYFPPEDRYGRIGFKHLLLEIMRVWREQPDKVRESGEALASAIAESALRGGGEHDLTPDLLANATRHLAASYDATYGGFGGAPKFPPSMALDLLLREHQRTGEAHLLEMVERTLQKMARGGIYDHLGGGFHRYAVDHVWLAPHFEKMLYDNALLAPVYFDAALVTGNAFYERIGRETLDYVLREMTDPAGGFYSTQDADSEGQEGKYYIWRPEQVREELGDAEAANLLCEYYDITPRGNWEEVQGASILNVRVPLEEFARLKGLDPEALRQRLNELRRRLLVARARRVPPLKDDKVLAGWNGLMITALARGAQATGDWRYAEAGERAARFILNEMRTPAGELLRTWRQGQARIPAFLEDYANLIAGLLDLYETTFDPEWPRQADALARLMIEHFYDEQGGGFFTTDGRDRTLVARVKEFYDGALPAGNSAAVYALLRLGVLLGRDDYRERAWRTLRLLAESMREVPAAHHRLLSAAAFELAPSKEVAIIGKPDAPATLALLAVVRRRYRPHQMLAVAPGEVPGDLEKGEDPVALTRDKTALGGRPTAYVCQNNTCQPPVREPEELAALLGA